MLLTSSLTLLSLSLALATGPETVEIPVTGGDSVEAEIHLPPDYSAGSAYNVVVGPGNYYWKRDASQPGWIVVASDAFYGPDRLKTSRAAIEWLRERYEVKGGGFHIAGWSANSAGVFEIARTYPLDYLSVTGIAGMPGSGTESRLKEFRGLKVQFVVGEKDTYWRQGSERWHELMNKEGLDSTLEIIPNGQHVMDELIGKPIFQRLNKLVE
jgi:hypothetical protein